MKETGMKILQVSLSSWNKNQFRGYYFQANTVLTYDKIFCNFISSKFSFNEL